MKTILMIFMLTLLLGIASYAQQIDKSVKDKKYVSVDMVLPVIVPQPNCPIKIENVVAVSDSEGRIHILYQIKNIGEKEIIQYSIARWYSDNTGYLGAGAMPEKEKAIKTNESVSIIPKSLLAAAQTLQQIKPPEINGNKEIQKIAIVMIVGVLFSDGTKFSETERFNALQRHLERPQDE